jgi:FlaA1/EpsC-like NDP-sugar epimerase
MGLENSFLSKVRPEINNEADFELLKSHKVFITGAKGSIGGELVKIFEQRKIEHLATDIDDCNVLNFEEVEAKLKLFQPSVIAHLAADKHAPDGELNPEQTLQINVQGTINIINAKNSMDGSLKPKLVISSTCKACDPETVYGASKLIAERLVLKDMNTVARFYNVIESSKNVFEIWEDINESLPIPVTPCRRYFISKSQAMSLLIRCLAISIRQGDNFTPGRFTINPGEPISIKELAKEIYPLRQLQEIHPRRGDRLTEPLVAQSEIYQQVDGALWEIKSQHDL